MWEEQEIRYKPFFTLMLLYSDRMFPSVHPGHHSLMMVGALPSIQLQTENFYDSSGYSLPRSFGFQSSSKRGSKNKPPCRLSNLIWPYLPLILLFFPQEDSLILWKDICTNKLLVNANLILFFNKVTWGVSLIIVLN